MVEPFVSQPFAHSMPQLVVLAKDLLRDLKGSLMNNKHNLPGGKQIPFEPLTVFRDNSHMEGCIENAPLVQR